MRGVIWAVAAAAICTGPAAAQGLAIKEGKGTLEIRAGDKLVATFQHASWSRPIFYPLHSPGGAVLTRSWPIVDGVPGEAKDHPWQKSAWFVHGDVIAEGRKLKTPRKGVDGTDFWADGLNGCGKIVCTKVEVKKATGNHLVIVTKNEWIDADGEKVLDETRTIHVHQLEGAWLIVVHSDLFASTSTIVFGDTKEGSFGIRINESITGKTGKGKIQNADGKIGEKACWGHPSAWCDYSGPIAGKEAGLAVLTDPKNPYPSCWHVREYGLMAANPFGRTKSGFPSMKGRTDVVRLEKGKHLEFRFGLLLHDGDAVSGRVADHYRTFVGLREKE